MSVLVDALRGHTKVALLGIPRHRNLGDSMIAGGTLALLRRMNVEVVYLSDLAGLDLKVLHALPQDLPVLFLGGGNLGDLYPYEEESRLRVIATDPDRRYVVLPQTIHFENTDAVERSARVYSSAPDLTLLVRDRRSQAFAEEAFPHVEAVWSPDHALGWTPTVRPSHMRRPRVVARRDEEAMHQDRDAPADDWTWSRLNHLAWRAATGTGSVARRLPSTAPTVWVASKAAASQTGVNLRAAEKIASNSSAIATNRLHAHILSCLSGVPSFVADNSYGKVKGIFDEYSGGFTTANWCEDLDQAIARLPGTDTQASSGTSPNVNLNPPGAPAG
ncbi:polysaccharide pyruvyl transferase family protein [Kribbia dieselivorans]|uniref:polysaccharide pyruvyl transferase family protein n=1 Tax=Kribbia dieselivorans TaxID=331526 RepID=UPI00146FF10B|nr:polysaccharide pyruvyl transferase family protein [Kribbia dieselivorans]